MDDIQSVEELNGDLFCFFKICTQKKFAACIRVPSFFIFGKEGQLFFGAKDGTTLGIRFQRKRDLPYMPCSSATCQPGNLLRDWHTKTTTTLKSKLLFFCVFFFLGSLTCKGFLGCFKIFFSKTMWFFTHRFPTGPPGPCDPAETTTGASWSQATLMENTSEKTDQILLPAWRQLRWHLWQRKPTEIRNPCPKVVAV